eukprot:CAMPEP_0202882662 /NCGR_PEP_ID=MMETSP1391-20130828/38339_1 /ASSEMBLY_ACC=CAM_ASM_000867 /TAXON_ID=1034604 /ORGANISM="Chlamydomonas leiostraca, Strain SAG 11-49" /LENGTH=46 /DNA_ID= /DNA_START= /DNA_END= /DNA_ORIENTATION=
MTSLSLLPQISHWGLGFGVPIEDADNPDPCATALVAATTMQRLTLH